MAIATVEERITRGWCENTSFVFFDAEKYDRFKHVVNFAQSVLDKVCSNVPVHHFSSACTGAHAGAHAGDDAGAAGAGGEGAGAGADADRAGNHAERMLNLQKNSMHIITSTLYLCGFCEGYFATKAKELSSTFFILNGINNINPHLIVITPSTPVVFVKNKKATGVEPRVQVCRIALPELDVVNELRLKVASMSSMRNVASRELAPMTRTHVPTQEEDVLLQIDRLCPMYIAKSNASAMQMTLYGAKKRCVHCTAAFIRKEGYLGVGRNHIPDVGVVCIPCYHHHERYEQLPTLALRDGVLGKVVKRHGWHLLKRKRSASSGTPCDIDVFEFHPIPNAGTPPPTPSYETLIAGYFEARNKFMQAARRHLADAIKK
eukprot:CAMPEP_0198714248 /NCGR_PEP_ID=MMETSP1471-20131121/18553_1 /TAXON_ID=41880 /ORGANISM="Pycnococcus provasolii, Strain RCC733" /LENGTH=375 /DNA_ID=CAMNT_0044474519 /DNA_START=5 /DNA_END=1132 /DNA_ORIENTATION=-